MLFNDTNIRNFTFKTLKNFSNNNFFLFIKINKNIKNCFLFLISF